MTERILTQVQAPKVGFLRRVHGVMKGLTEVKLRPGQETSLAPPHLNLRSFESMYCIEEKACDIVGTFRRLPSDSPPGHCAALITPLMWHFATNCAAVKFAEPWMSKHFSKLREHNHVSSATYPECPTNDWWGKPCWLNPRESDPNVVQGPGGVTSSRPCLVPSWCGASRTIRSWSWGFPSGCCPRRHRTFRSGYFGLSRFGMSRFGQSHFGLDGFGLGTFCSWHFCT